MTYFELSNFTAAVRGPATQETAWKDCRQEGGIINIPEVKKNHHVLTQLSSPEKQFWAVRPIFQRDHYLWGDGRIIQGLCFD